MNQYIKDTEFASQSLINIIYQEESHLTELTEKFDYLERHFDHLQWDFSSAEKSDDYDDLQVQSKFIKMAKFSEENNLKSRKLELDEIEKSIDAKKNSINSLAMSLLQIAKQGISTEHTNLINCPIGRNLGSETLKNIIWQSRNQALHCEEGNPGNPVKNCFINLTTDFGDEYDLTTDYFLNRAKKIVDLLEWKDYANYENDMIALIG